MEQYTIIKSILLKYSVFGNTAWGYGVAIMLFVCSLLALKIFQSVILARLRTFAKKTKTDFDDALLDALGKLGSWFYISVALLIAGRSLVIDEKIITPVSAILFLIVIKELIEGISRMIDYVVIQYTKRMEKTDSDAVHTQSMIRIFRGMSIVILWCIGLLLLLSNYGVDVTSLIASLGIGGLAVALALQSVLTDVFSSFSIFIDKPFQVGDYISLGGEDAGTVEHIGLKTTRLRTLRGEELVVPNKELTTSKVQNFRKLETRREVFTFAVRYDTAQKKLADIPHIVESIIDPMDQVSLSRCHLVKLGDSGLEYECVYNINSSDYLVFSHLRQEILLALHSALQKEKIALTYPTQTIVVEK